MIRVTVKERAKELVDKFTNIAGEEKWTDWTDKIHAKKCALIHVEEMIDFLNKCTLFNRGKDTDVIWGYYQGVKKEIEKL